MSPEESVPYFQPPSPYYQDNKDNLWLHLLNHQKMLEEIEHLLKGEVFVPNKDGTMGGVYVKKFDTYIPEERVNDIMFILYGQINENTEVTQFTKEQVASIMLATINEIDLYLGTNAHLFGIEKSKIPIISNIIENNLFALFNKSKDAMLITNIARSTQRQEQIIHREEPKKRRGLFNFFGGKKDAHPTY